MTVIVRQYAPVAIVFVVVTWCCWPYLNAPEQLAAMNQGKKLPRISRAMLDPEIIAASERDPFEVAVTKTEVEPISYDVGHIEVSKANFHDMLQEYVNFMGVEFTGVSNIASGAHKGGVRIAWKREND